MVQVRDDVPRTRLTGQLVWFLFWLAVTVAALLLRPSTELHGTHQQLGLPACPSVALFDRPCFGCGLTTSFTAFLHGDFATSFQAHAFGPVFYVLFTLSAGACLWCWRKGLYLDTGTRAFNRAAVALTTLFVLFGAVRFATVTYDSAEHQIARAAMRLGGGEEGR